MTTDDGPQFFSRLLALGELFRTELSPALQTIYFSALESLSLEDVLSACNQAAQYCRFMPKPVELREFILGSTDDGIEKAWLEYKRLARQIGGYQSPTMDAALAETLVAVFGSWEGACWSDFTPEMWTAKRREFGRTYGVYRNRVAGEQRRLTGAFEHDSLTKVRLTTLTQQQIEDGSA